MIKKQNDGFTLMEVMISLALISIFVVMVINYSSILNKRSNISRSNNTKNRILSGVRDLAGMPASLRVSMRASSGGLAVNKELLACAGGNPVNNCDSGGPDIPFTLYSPFIERWPNGTIKGVSAISAPLNGTTPKRIDTFGTPCPEGSPASLACPLLVFTSFRAQCGPPPAAAPVPAVNISPMLKCTVADVIEVTYTVRLDQSVETSDPELKAFVTPISGTVVVSVEAISGNKPQ
jgi:prepilin-type N-terminal cleavage/methylation domain-containing protein